MKQAHLRLRVAPGVIQAEAIHRQDIVWAGESVFEEAAGLSEAVAQLAAAPTMPCRKVTVILLQPLVQLRTIAGLPPVRPALLVEVIAHQASRFFRKNGVALVTDAVWVPNGKTPLARAAAVGEPIIEAIAAGARAAGLELESITTESDGPRLELLPSSERAERGRRHRRTQRRIWSLGAVLMLAACAVYVTRLTTASRRASQLLAASQEPLGAVLAARQELRVAETTLQAARRATATHGRTLELLAQLSRSLPDSAVITSVTIRDDGSGVLSGLARRASVVIARLQALRAFPHARLQGSVNRESIAGRDWERFTLEWQP